MAQISLYIDDKTLKMVENAASRQHMSVSKWVAEQIRARLVPAYPPGFEDLFGSVKDDTFKAPPRVGFDADVDRASL